MTLPPAAAVVVRGVLTTLKLAEAVTQTVASAVPWMIITGIVILLKST